ncbi:MAG: retroviral-like aspartic protease family protein [Sphingomonas sp.]|nr:retroviral-like aspartic protease family protein [Sphingomonas sp.]
MALTGSIIALALAAQAAPAVPPASSSITPNAQASPAAASDELAFTTDRYDRMTVEVRVAGKGPYRFLVDTGADRSAVSRALAEQLSLERRSGVTLHSAAGISQVAVVRVPRLEFETRAVHTLDAPMLEAADMGADGILGIDTLRSQRIVIDFKNDRLYLTATPRRERRLDADEIIVTGRLKRGHLILTNAEIDGENVTIVIDTGAQMSIGNSALLKVLQRNRRLSVPVPLEQVAVTGELLTGELYVAEQLQFDGVTMRNLGIMFADAETFRAIGRTNSPTLLLGMNALRGFDQVEIDLASKKLRLRIPRVSLIREPVVAGQDAAPSVGH